MGIFVLKAATRSTILTIATCLLLAIRSKVVALLVYIWVQARALTARGNSLAQILWPTYSVIYDTSQATVVVSIASQAKKGQTPSYFIHKRPVVLFLFTFECRNLWSIPAHDQ